MTHFIARPLSTAVAEDARSRFAVGDPTVVRAIVATPLSSPCRHCLRDGEVGEAMLLFSHAPFEATGPYAERGPVFVHERQCAPADLAVDQLPEVTRVRKQVVARAYDQHGAIHDAALVDAPDAAAALRTFLEDANVAFVHVRSVTYGCFSYAVERAG